MKFAIVKCVNGNYSVVSEGHTTEKAALVAFHHQCEILWNSDDVITAEVAILDEQLDIYHGCKEFIHHEPEDTEQGE